MKNFHLFDLRWEQQYYEFSHHQTPLSWEESEYKNIKKPIKRHLNICKVLAVLQQTARNSFGCYMAMFSEVMDQQYYHLILQWRGQVGSWRAIQTHCIKLMFLHITEEPVDAIIVRGQHCQRTGSHSLSLQLFIYSGFVSKCVLWKLFKDDQMAFTSCITSKERGEPMLLAGGEAATVAPWHNILHYVHRLCSSWQGGQAMCWLLRDSLVQCASIEIRFKVITSKHHTVNYVQWNDTNDCYRVEMAV